MPIISASKISKSFNGRAVLDNIDLDLEKGQLIALIGPSGVGKTTLLRLLSGLIYPDSGNIKVMDSEFSRNNGNDISLRRELSMIFQKPVILNGTVMDNVVYPLKLRGIQNGIERAEKILSGVKLNDLADCRARDLSGGEMQRLAFARATIYNPKILFLDEFTAHLDPGNIKMLENALLAFMKENDTTVIIATHNMFQAKRISEITAFMFDKGIIEIGPTSTIFNDPADERTRAFVNGEMVF